jgi:hypothetical protein
MHNELIAAILIGLLLSISAGVRITLPLLAIAILAYEHVIRLPSNLAWLDADPTLILLCVAFVVETIVHFIPAAGTLIKAAATPLAFVAGTLLMAVPLGDKNPIYQWVLAGALGGGAATFTHLGFTGLRGVTAPANLASGGIFGLGWNMFELFLSSAFIALSGICVVAGWVVALAILVLLGIALLVFIWKASRHWSRWRPSPAPPSS